MKVASFTDFINTPSSRFRIRQYFPYLEKAEINYFDYCRKYSLETAGSKTWVKRIRSSPLLITKAIFHESLNIANRFNGCISANKCDVIWLSRELILGYPSFEFMLKKPLVYDVDDAIFLAGIASKWKFKKVTEMAAAVIAGNEYLAENVSLHCNNVHVVPTAVDTARWNPLKNKSLMDNRKNDIFKIGWCGTSSSFKYFLPYEREIKRFLIEHASAQFYIMADRFPHELDILKSNVQFFLWNENTEVDFVRSLDVGLMPIKNDLWCQGKCAYKMLLYAACGVPVIVSPVGVNKIILNSTRLGFGPEKEGEWYDALCMLFNSPSTQKEFSCNAIKLVSEQYALDVCAPKIINILRSCA